MTKLGLDIARCRGVGPVSSADILLGRGLRMQLGPVQTQLTMDLHLEVGFSCSSSGSLLCSPFRDKPALEWGLGG